MTNHKDRSKHMKFRKESTYEEPDIREVKLILLGVLIVGLMWFFVIPELTATAQPLRFLDGLIPEAFAESQNIVMTGDELNIQHTGLGATCPIITGPASATDVTPTTWTLRQAADDNAGGCWVSVFTNDRTTTTDSLLPSLYDDFLTGLGFIVDIRSITGNPLDEDCKIYEVSGFGGDARLNVTDAYDLIQGRFANATDQILDCDVGTGSVAGLDPTFYATPTFVYTDSMAFNNTFFQVGLHTQVDARFTTFSLFKTMGIDVATKFSFINPLFTNNTIWMMQEHPKFPASTLDGGFFGIDDTTFTMDSNAVDDTDIGQVVVFKEFLKSNLTGLNSLAFYDQQESLTPISEPEGWIGPIVGTTSGGSGTVTVVAGKFGNALSYPDPNNNKVSQFDVSAENVTTLLDGLGGSGLSINWWGKHSDAAFQRNIVEIGNGAQSKMLRLEEGISSPNLRVLAQNLDGGTINNFHSGFFIDDDGQFHMYSVTFNSTHYDIWRDGSFISSTSHTATGVSGAIDSHIGWGGGMVNLIPSNTNGCDCILDELSIWNTTLSATQISDLYNGGEGVTFGSDAVGKTDIRITGGYQAQTASGDMWVRMEIKDGSYGTQSLNSFPINEYDIYQGGGSLGVVHLEPSDLAITPFDVTFTPNWADSTEDSFTIFMGVDDNSTAGSLIVNITSIELGGEIKYDFEDINDIFFYEPSFDALGGDLAARVGAIDYNAGLTNITAITPVGLTPTPLPTPSATTGLVTISESNSTVNLQWDQNLLNVTDYKINRDGVKVGETNGGPFNANFTDSGLDPSTNYFYEVCALNGNINGTCATASQETVGGDLPAFPINVVATFVGGDVSIDWDDSANTLNYTIQRRNDTASEVTFTTIATGLLVSDYLDTTVSPSTDFTYKIFSFNVFGNNTEDVADVPDQPDLADLAAYYQFNNDDIVPTTLQSQADAIQNLGTLGDRQDASFFCNTGTGACLAGNYFDPPEALVPGLFGQAAHNNGTASTQGSRWDLGNSTTKDDFKFLWANSITNLTSVNFWVQDPFSARLAGTTTVTPILGIEKFNEFMIRTTTGSAALRISLEDLGSDPYRVFTIGGPSITADTDWHMITMRVNRENATQAWEMCVDDGLTCLSLPPQGSHSYVPPNSDPESAATKAMSIGRDGCTAGSCLGRTFNTDELAFWDNTWLSDAERTYLYNAGLGVELVLGLGASVSNQVLTNSLPDPPINITAIAVGLTVEIDWNDALLANDYTVQRRNDTASEVTFTTIATGVLTSDYTDSTVSEEHLFTYKIFSVNEVGNSTQVIPAGQTFPDPYGYYKFDTNTVTTNGMGFRNLGDGGSQADGFMSKQTSGGVLDVGTNVTASIVAGTMSSDGILGQAVLTNDTGNNLDTQDSTWVEFGTEANRGQWHFLNEIDIAQFTTIVFWTNGSLVASETAMNILQTDSIGEKSMINIITGSLGPAEMRSNMNADDFGATKRSKFVSFPDPPVPTTGWHMVSVTYDKNNDVSGGRVCVFDGSTQCIAHGTFTSLPLWNAAGTSNIPQYQLLLGPPAGFCQTPGSCESPGKTIAWGVDELSIFNGTLLNDTELNYLYNSGAGQAIITDEIDSISNQVLTNGPAPPPPPTPIEEWQLREHKLGVATTPQHGFRVFNNVLETNTADTGVSHINARFGEGLVFKSFEKADIEGKDISVLWQGYILTAPPPDINARLEVFDGALDRQSSTDFPESANMPALLLGANNTAVSEFSLRLSTLKASDIDYGSSVEDFVTISLRLRDTQTAASERVEIHSVQIGNGTSNGGAITLWNFTNPIVDYTETFANQSERGIVTASACTGQCPPESFVPTPPPPTDVLAIQNPTNITLTWTKEPSADGYNVYRIGMNDTDNGIRQEGKDFLPATWLHTHEGTLGRYTPPNHYRETVTDSIPNNEDTESVGTVFTAVHDGIITGITSPIQVSAACTNDGDTWIGSIWNGTGSFEFLANSTNSILVCDVAQSSEWYFDDFEITTGESYIVGVHINGTTNSATLRYDQRDTASEGNYAGKYTVSSATDNDFVATGDFLPMTIYVEQHLKVATLGDVDEYIDTDLEPGIVFFYKIRSTDSGLEGPDSLDVNATAALIDGTDILNSTSPVWQFREHESYVANPFTLPNFNFTTNDATGDSSTDVFEMDTGDNDGSGDNKDGGTAWLFKVFPIDDIDGSDIIVNWEGGFDHISTQLDAVIRVYDGIMHKDSGLSFPSRGEPETQFHPILGSFVESTIPFDMRQDILLAENIDYASAGEFVTVAIVAIDNSLGEINLRVANVTVSKIAQWDFTGMADDGSQIIYTRLKDPPAQQDTFIVTNGCPGPCTGIDGFHANAGFINVTSSNLILPPTVADVLNLVATADTDGITLTWDSADNATAYRIFRTSTESNDEELIFDTTITGVLTRGLTEGGDNFDGIAEHFDFDSSTNIFKDEMLSRLRTQISVTGTTDGTVSAGIWNDANGPATTATLADSTNSFDASTLSTSLTTVDFKFRDTDLLNKTSDFPAFQYGSGVQLIGSTTGTVNVLSNANLDTGGSKGALGQWNSGTNNWDGNTLADIRGEWYVVNRTKLSADPEIPSTGDTSTIFLDDFVGSDEVSGHTYFYRLVGLNFADEQGGFSNVANATALGEKPDRITDLTATPTNSVFLEWSAPNGTITGYRVERVLGTEALSGDGDKDLLHIGDFNGLNEAGSVDASDPFIQGQRIVLQHDIRLTYITSFLRLGGGGCAVAEAGATFGIVLDATDGTVLGNSTNSANDFCGWSAQSPNPIRFEFDPPVELFEGEDVVLGIQKTGKHTGIATDFHILAKMSTANAFTDNAVITGSPGGLVQDMNTTDGISFGAASAVSDATHNIWYLGHEVLVADTGDTATNFTDTSCPEGITCHYLVSALNGLVVADISNRVNATETIVDFSTDDNIWNSTSSVWQYREHDKASFQPGLNFSNTDDSNNYLQVNTWFHCDPPGSKCAGNTQNPFAIHPAGEETYIGNGLVFKTFKRTELENATITFDWKTTTTGTQSGANVVVFDGPLHREDYTHWPTGFVNGNDVIAPIQTGIANGTLGVIDTTGNTNVDEILSVVMNSTIINWQDATHELTTIVFTKFDSHSNAAQSMVLRSVEISTLGLWNFTNVQTLNTTGALYALPNTSGFGSSMGGWNSTSSIINPNENWGDGMQDSGLYNATLGLADGGGFTLFELPTAPENVIATALDTDVLIEWDEVIAIPNVTQYHVQRFLVGFSDDFTGYDPFPQQPGVNSLTDASLWSAAFDGTSAGVQGFGCLDPDLSLANLFPLNPSPFSTDQGTPKPHGVTPDGQSLDSCQDLNVTSNTQVHLEFTHRRGSGTFVGQIGQVNIPTYVDEFSVSLRTLDAFGGGGEVFVGGTSFVGVQYNFENGTTKNIVWQTGRSAGTCATGFWLSQGAQYCNALRVRTSQNPIGINNNDLDALTGSPNSGATFFAGNPKIFQEVVSSGQFGITNTVAQNVTSRFLIHFGPASEYEKVESWDLYIGGSGVTSQTQGCPLDINPVGQGPEDECRVAPYVGVDMLITDVTLSSGGVEQPQFADSFETIATLTPEEAQNNEWLIREHRRAGNLEPRMGYFLSTAPEVVGGNNTLVMSQADTLGLHTDIAGTINGGGHIYKTFPLSFIEGKDITVEAQGYCGSSANCNPHGVISISINDGSWKDNDQDNCANCLFPLNDILNSSAVGVGTFELVQSVSATDPSAGIFNLTLTAPDLSTATGDEVTLDLSNTDGSVSASAQHEIFRLIIGNVTTGITVYNFENADINYTDNEFIHEDVGTVTPSVTGDSIPLSYLDTTVDPGVAYAYRILAENLVGNATSDFSEVLTNNVPDQVDNLDGIRTTPTSIDLDWDLEDDSGIGNPSFGINLTKIQIFRSENGGAFTLEAENFPNSPPNNFFNNTGLLGTGSYDYKISGCNIVGCGANATIFFPPPPDTPTNVNATAILPNVLVQWTGNATTDTDYIIERGNSSAFGSWTMNEHPIGGNPPLVNTEFSHDITGIFLSPDGSLLFVTDGGERTINKYSLSTPFDVTTKVSIQNSTDLSTTLGSKWQSVTDQHWKPDGLKVVLTDITATSFFEYTLSTPWDLSTLAFNAEQTTPPSDIRGIWIMADGTQMFGMRLVTDTMYHWKFGTAWDITTVTQFDTTPTTPIGSTGPTDVAVRPDGRVFIGTTIGGGLNDAIREWNVTGDPFDIDTLATVGGMNVGQDGAVTPEPRTFHVPLSGNILYIDDVVDDEIWMFNNNTDNVFPFGTTNATFVPISIQEFPLFPPEDPNGFDTPGIFGPEFYGWSAKDIGTNVDRTICCSGGPFVPLPAIGINFDSSALHGAPGNDERLEYHPHRGGGENVLLYDLQRNLGTGNFLSDNWEWTGFVNVTFRSAGTEAVVRIGISDSNVTQSANQDSIAGFLMNDVGFVGLGAEFGDDSFMPVNPFFGSQIGIVATQPYWFKLVRENATFVTFEMFNDEAMTSSSNGLYNLTIPDTVDNLRYLKIYDRDNLSGSGIFDTWYDNFTITNNGEVIYEEDFSQRSTEFLDTTVELATNYAYRVIAVDVTEESVPSEQADVLTNDLPQQVLNVTSEYQTINDILVNWNAITFDGDGNPTTGMNLLRYDIFRKNVTAGETEFSFLTSVNDTTTSFIDVTQTFPDQLDYTVSACNEIGCGQNSTEAETIFDDPPDPTVNVIALAVNNTVALDWDDTPFAINYTITRALNNITHVIIVEGIPVSEVSDDTVCKNCNYTYGVYAVNNNGNGTTGFSNSVVTNDLPTAPFNFTAAMGIVIPDLEDVFLDWEHPIDNGTGDPSTGVDIIHYQVERKQGLGPFSFLANTSDATPSFEDDTVVSSANYTWKVRGVNAVGFSPFSNIFSLITTPLMPPDAPTNLTANTISGTKIDLAWLEAVTGDPATEFVLQQRHVGFGGFVTIATIQAPFTFFMDMGLIPGDTYDYQVRSDNGAGVSPYSAIATNTTFTFPTAPQDLSATTLNQTSIFLDWEAPIVTNGIIVKYNIEQESPIGGGFSEIAETEGSGLTTINGTWQYREHKTNALNAAAFWFANPGVINLGPLPSSHHDGLFFKTMPTSFLNNTNIYVEWSYSHDVSDTQNPQAGLHASIRVLDGPNDAFEYRAINGTQMLTSPTGEGGPCGVTFPVVNCYTADDNYPRLSTWTYNQTEFFQVFVGGWAKRTDTMQDVVIPTNSTRSTLMIIGHDHQLVLDMNNFNIFTINITDSTTDVTKAFWDFTDGNTQNCQFGFPCQGVVPNEAGEFEDDNFMPLIVEEGDSAGTQFTVLGLTPRTEYNFRVNAENIIGEGPFSNEAANTTFGVPSAPLNLDSDTNGISEITVEWDEPANDFGSPVTGYRIDQAQGVGGTFITAIANTGNNIEPLEELFVGLLQQTTYIFRIAGFNSFGLGDFSANLTSGTFIGPSPPENFFVIFNSTRPYSTFMSWETPLSDGGKPIQGYLVERKDLGGSFTLIANLTSPLLLNFTDNNLINLAEHEYRVAAYSNPIGTFTAGQPVTTVVAPSFQNFVINDFQVVGDVLSQQYSITIDDCFPACTLTQADIERNGIVESNFAVGEPITLDQELNFTSHFILIEPGTQLINTTAIVTNLGITGANETGIVTTSLEFAVDTIFFDHSRTVDFQELNFELVRHPIPWNSFCELRGGEPAFLETIIELPFGGQLIIPSNVLVDPFGITATLDLQSVGTFSTPPTFDVIPNRNAYMSCDDPAGIQILAFTSFGTGNGTLALTGFTDQLGTFLGVPVPFIFIIILAAIWTGRSASTGIIFLAVAIGALGVLGYFDPLTGEPETGDALGYFWGFIVVLTLIGVFLGKRFF